MLLQFCPFWSRGARFGVSMMLCCCPACLCCEFRGVLWCVSVSAVSEEVLFCTCNWCMCLVAVPTLVPSIVLSSCSFAMCLVLGSSAGRILLESGVAPNCSLRTFSYPVSHFSATESLYLPFLLALKLEARFSLARIKPLCWCSLRAVTSLQKRSFCKLKRWECPPWYWS